MIFLDNKLIAYFFISLFISFCLIKVLIKYSRSLHLIDSPDYRKFHDTETPLVGGLGIILTFLFIFFISWIFEWHLIYYDGAIERFGDVVQRMMRLSEYQLK